MFLNQLELEANLLDLLCLETLRVFEPAAYRHLEAHAECVFGPNSALRPDQAQRSEHKAKVEALLDKSVLREATHEVLASVFPQIGWLRDNSGHGIGFEERWLRERRACHPEQFYRYFRLTVEKKETSAAFMNQLHAAASDRDALCDLILSVADQSRISEALRRFELVVEDVPEGSELEVVHALFRLGDLLDSRDIGFDPSAPRFTLWRIIRSLFLRTEAPAVRSAAFCKQLEETPYLWLPCQVTALEEPDENEPLSPKTDILTQQGVSNATAICAKKIAKAAAANRITGRAMMFYLYRWRDWSGEEPVMQWVKQYTDEPDNAVKFLRAVTREVAVVSANRAEIRLEPNLNGLRDFIDPKTFRLKVAHFLDAAFEASGQASEEDQQLRRLWKRAFEQLDEQS